MNTLLRSIPIIAFFAIASCNTPHCISCYKDEIGYIYFWDHENEVDYKISNDMNYSNLYLVAKSFSEFIDGLKEYFG